MTSKLLGGIFSQRLSQFQFNRAVEGPIEVNSIKNMFVLALKTRSIVVASTSSIKALFLKFVETIGLENVRQSFIDIFELLGKATLLLDECDVLLHPMRSELNFPVGRKEDLLHREWRVETASLLVNAVGSHVSSAIQNGMALDKIQDTPHSASGQNLL